MTVPDHGRTFRRLAANLSLASVYALFVYAHLLAFARRYRPSHLILAIAETLIIVAALTRREPQAVRRDWATVITAAGGAFLPLLLRPLPGAPDLPAAEILQLVGLTLLIATMLSLRRAFGLLPADRGVVTGGLYRLVRHPLYLSYLFTQGGYLLNNPSAHNLTVWATSFAFQLLRIRREEELLLRNDGYAVYVRSVTYRLLPGVW